MKTTDLYREQLWTIRANVCGAIKSLFEKHQTPMTEALCDTCVNPCIIRDSSNEEDIFTLDRVGIDSYGKLYMDASSSWTNDTFYVNDVDTEILIDVLELLIDGEDELFVKDVEYLDDSDCEE